MENNQDPPRKHNIDLPEIIRELKDNKIPDLNKNEIKELFNNIDPSVINDMLNGFNTSVKNIFDLGFKLANSLDLNKILDYFEDMKSSNTNTNSNTK
ncbi:MAG: hypothetical protein BAJALOKI1v1_2400003 [Promethearchaeota archaeon]|nr:MAG: hypothetical protein BAJALOKI1v1_2400003 [Candidatus Lokiarchaeota archaeon]